MIYSYEFTKHFQKEIKKIKIGNFKKIKKINETIELIIIDPFNSQLYFKKMLGKKNKIYYRYEIGKKYRMLIEIIIKEKHIIFLKVESRENFYS